RGQGVEVLVALRLREIAVERDVGGGPEPALAQIHQYKGEVVEHVAGGDQIAELDGVEQDGLAVDEHDIAEMQVAGDAANEAAPVALGKERRKLGERTAAGIGEVLVLGRGKDIGSLAERFVVLFDVPAERRDPAG